MTVHQCNRVTGHRTSNLRPQGAFTLAELLIAVAVLGVGLSMVASLFPAALRENQRSTDDVLGSIICQNGLAVVKSKVTHSSDPFSGHTWFSNYSGLGNDCYFPVGDSDSNMGFCITGRMIEAGKNDYVIAILAYRTRTSANPIVRWINGTISDLDDVSEVSVTNNPHFVQMGTPMLIGSGADAGAWGYVVAWDEANSKAVLDRRLPPGANVSMRVLHENGATESPAIGVLIARTALKD